MSDALYLRTARGDVRVSTRWYDFTLLEGHGEVLVLPAPSPFLRGAHPLPDNRAAMPAFVAGLEAMGDGAAPGFRTLLECHSDEVAEWFGRLLTRAPLRRRLTPWLAAQGERLRAFEPELHCDSGPETGVLLLALTWEPMFSHVRTFHIHTGARQKTEHPWHRFLVSTRGLPFARTVVWQGEDVSAEFSAGLAEARPIDDTMLSYALNKLTGERRETISLPRPTGELRDSHR